MFCCVHGTKYPPYVYFFVLFLGRLFVEIVNKKKWLVHVVEIVNKKKTQIPCEEIEQEIETLKNLDHPHIIRLFEYAPLP